MRFCVQCFQKMEQGFRNCVLAIEKNCKLSEIQQKIIEDQVNFEVINSVSLSTVDRVLKRNRLRMKQLYRVPFDRNSDRVKEQRFQYVQVGIYPDTFNVDYSK